MDKSFPSYEFDQWASQYDKDVHTEGFPFTGYQRVLEEVAHLADAKTGMSILDLGIGTGNLSLLFAPLQCELWGLDFSEAMLEIAQAKIPSARLNLHDLRQPFLPPFNRRFDLIVSAYTFHHFELPDKNEIIQRLLQNYLALDGRLVIADISFPTEAERDSIRKAASDRWDDEPYWIATEAVPALETLGKPVKYVQVTSCAGVYMLKNKDISG